MAVGLLGLFEAAVAFAREADAKALYVSATPTENTVDFYLNRGCVLAPEPDQGSSPPSPTTSTSFIYSDVHRPRRHARVGRSDGFNIAWGSVLIRGEVARCTTRQPWIDHRRMRQYSGISPERWTCSFAGLVARRDAR
jgi:hypothetical protein